jgi:DNA processing protein
MADGKNGGVTGTPHLSEAQRLAWLRLIRSENVGPATFRMLVNRFGGAEKALDMLPELSARGGLKRRVAICSEADAIAEIEAANRLGISIIGLGEPEYPQALRHCEGAPPLIFACGNIAVLTRPMVAIAGSRNCSAAGKRIAGNIAAGLAAAGYVVVSGLARGIDAAAHRASLAAGTIAVLAGGVDVIYPRENEGLYGELLEQGAAISEMRLGLEPRGQDFPRRNRIIAGLGLATVIIEAAQRSGSLITARLAGETGREVCAVPGSPLDPRAAGTNRLIRDGAVLARSADDVIEALAPLRGGSAPRPGDLFAALEDSELDFREQTPTDTPEIGEDARRLVAAALNAAPVEIDDIIRHTGLGPGAVHMALLELELAGRLARHAGQRVSAL